MHRARSSAPIRRPLARTGGRDPCSLATPYQSVLFRRAMDQYRWAPIRADRCESVSADRCTLCICADRRPSPRLPAAMRPVVVLALCTVYLVWSSTYLAVRVAVETLPPLLMCGARFTLAGAALYALMRLR